MQELCSQKRWTHTCEDARDGGARACAGRIPAVPPVCSGGSRCVSLVSLTGRWAAGKGFAFLPAPREAVLISLGWSLGIAALKLPQRLPPAPTAGTRFLHLVIYSSSVNRREAGGALSPERL